MTKFEILSAVAAPIAIDNLDTDQMFPSRFIGMPRPAEGLGNCFLHDLRFGADGFPRSEFVLNDPRLSGSAIIVASANYGCGSGRPGAIAAHRDFGIRAVIAESFGPVFSAVAYKSGLLTIGVTRDEAAALRRQLTDNPGSTLTIDLGGEHIIGPSGTVIAFSIDPFVRALLMAGASELDLTLAYEADIARVAAAQRQGQPWLFDRKEPAGG